jgi:hypothetical protein
MKLNRNILTSFVLLVVIASIYRVMPRPMGFAPQIAMALFAGSVVKDRKYAFALPLLSMFLSDLLYQGLYTAGLTPIEGFYSGQLTNYLMLTALTVIGFFIRERSPLSIAAGSIAGPTVYFLASNFLVWIGGGGYSRPKTLEGLMMCYNDGLPFYQTSIFATLFFSAVLFTGYYFAGKAQTTPAVK